MSKYTNDRMPLYKDGLWNEDGWAEDYVKWVSVQDPVEIQSELRTLLTHLSRKELETICHIFENYYLEEEY